jgi:predicted GIY-YIG superfamily endonuclease
MSKSPLARFKKKAEALDKALRFLCAEKSGGKEGSSDRPPRPGVYLFSEGDNHLYIGRTRDIQRRYRDHTNPGSRENQAGFAVLLALKEIGAGKASYVSDTSRAKLYRTEEFKSAFRKAKDRVKKMRFRFFEMADGTDQALLEIYCAVALKAPFNDFANH